MTHAEFTQSDHAEFSQLGAENHNTWVIGGEICILDHD